MGQQARRPELSEGEDFVGRTLGDFVLREKIGAGAYGAVYAAFQTLLAREAAVKVLHTRHLHRTEIVQRFVREARLASRFDHPYAAHIYSFGVEDDGVLWIAMELVRGVSLSQLLSVWGPIALEQFVPLLERIAEVVSSAHEQGIVHRDIKPANVMVLSRVGRLFPKLLDLGVARLGHVDNEDKSSNDDNDNDNDKSTDESDGPAEDPATFATTQRLSADLLDEWAQLSAEETAVITVDDNKFLRSVTEHFANAPRAELFEGAGADVTALGTLIGSPGYMAPELWSGHQANAKSDIYALGILAYEALTGRRPFTGAVDATTIGDTTERLSESIALQHIEAPIPSLGEDFSPALSDVIARSLAKDPENRFETALEFATAVRRSVGLIEDVDDVAQLPEKIREAVIAEGPQPIAEGVATLAAARTTDAARKALAALVGTVVRYLGSVALASRGHIVPPTGDSPRAVTLLTALRHGLLTDADWLELCCELCQPFAGSPTAHSIPELVKLLYADDSTARPVVELLSTLCSHAAASHEQRVGAVATALGAIMPLFTYPLVVGTTDVGERWTGLRRQWRTPVDVDANIEPGHAVLLGQDGAVALNLFPLVQALAPSPATPLELFFLSGDGRFGAKLAAIPVGFERQDRNVWLWFDRTIIDSSNHGEAVSESASAPYRGLASFTQNDADYFYGREREAEAFANRVRVQPLIAVVGPSGVGKSSFIHAGVVPMLPDNWRVISFRPGTSPFEALAAKLLGAGRNTVELATELRSEPSALRDRLAAITRARGITLLVVADQFEEILTLCSDPTEANDFLEALVLASEAEDASLRVVLTLRDDFLIRCQALPALRERLTQGLQLLSTPAPEDLLRILVEPARRGGFEFEGDGLCDEMVAEVAEQPGALALLSFTASKLWELRDRKFRRLTRKAYDALGGVGGALAVHAEAVLEDMSENERALVREAFRHLVTADGTRAVLSRHELEEVLGGEAASNSALSELIAARLLVASEANDADDRVEIIHETLLSSWPRLVEWQREDAANVRLRDQIRAAARNWEQRGRPGGLLWHGEALIEYRLWRSRYQGSLTSSEEAFARASLADDARDKRRRRIALIATFAILCVGLVVLWRMNQRADRNAVRAESNAVRAESNAAEAQQSVEAMFIEQGRQQLLAGRPLNALPYLDAAYVGAASPSAVKYLLGRGTRVLEQQNIVLKGHPTAVRGLEFSRNDDRIVSGDDDGSARLWDPRTGKVIAVLTGHEKRTQVVFSPSGEIVASAGGAGKLCLWSAKTGEKLREMRMASSVIRLVFSPDGTKLVAAGSGGASTVWTVASGELHSRLGGHDGPVYSAAFSSSGDLVATGGVDGVIRLWKHGGELVGQLTGHEGPVTDLAFARDDIALASAGVDGVVRLWNPAAREPLGSLVGHVGPVRAIAFLPNGKSIVTASEDGSSRLWDVQTMLPTRVFHGHRGIVLSVELDRTGRRLVTASADGTARLWDVQSGKELVTLEGHSAEVWRARFNSDGSAVATASFDGTVRLWKPTKLPTIAEPPATFEARSAAYSADGDKLVSAGSDGRLRVYDTTSGEIINEIEASDDELWYAALSPDGKQIVAAQQDGVGSVFDSAGQLQFELRGHRGAVNRALFSPDGGRILTVGDDGTARLWNARTGDSLRVFVAHEGGAWGAAFSVDGEAIATAGEDSTAAVWDAETGALRRRLQSSSSVNTVAFAADDADLVAAGDDGRVRIWNIESGRQVVAFEGHARNVTEASVSADGQRLATASFDGSARIWDLQTGRLLDSLEAHDGILYGARFSPDGFSLTTAGSDGRVVLWSLPFEERPVDEVAELIRCRVAQTLEQGRLVPTKKTADCERN